VLFNVGKEDDDKHRCGSGEKNRSVASRMDDVTPCWSSIDTNSSSTTPETRDAPHGCQERLCIEAMGGLSSGVRMNALPKLEKMMRGAARKAFLNLIFKRK
jgi:hypothetical protein